MVFSSILFLYFFLPSFFLAYFIAPKTWRNGVLLGASMVFYAWGAPVFIAILLASTGIDYYLTRWMDEQTGRRRTFGLVASVSLNLGLLLYFKYANFFFDNLDELYALLGLEGVHWVKVALPIGISFYTFQTLSYATDIYRKNEKPLNRLSDYFMYILMFPQLIAGPIIRYNEIQAKIQDRHVGKDDVLIGLHRFALGLGKKVLIANILGAFVDGQLGNGLPPDLSFASAWIIILAYALQIYFDFSGYSDMAIGLGRMMGFRFPENFDNPYISRSITEFWRRWHMTLSRWMRDYLYIPLGGNRRGTFRTYINLALVFLLSGLWHGASWNFMLWGGFHGFFLILDRLFLVRVLSKAKALAVPLTFAIVLFSWVLFRIESLPEVWAYWAAMLNPIDLRLPELSSELLLTGAVGLVFAFMGLFPKQIEWQTRWFGRASVSDFQAIHQTALSVILIWLCSAQLTAQAFNPFIYFRF